jgi:hypothetical protein
MANYEQYNSDYKAAKNCRSTAQITQAKEVEARVKRYYDQKVRFEKTKAILNKVVWQQEKEVFQEKSQMKKLGM